MKKSLVIALALMLVLALSTGAFAAQVLSGNAYLSTTQTMYTRDGAAGSTLSRVYANTKFLADGTTNYPYEIYLPNEQDPGDYRIHSSYAKNTDACASCHATHTAVGNYLLQWYSAYETCMACHDGTVSSTYNVLDGRVGADTDSAAPGGMFGMGGGSESNHNVTGALDIAAAPGGSLVEDEHGAWEKEFGCESCHSPHGNGGNARLLEPNPNDYALNAAKANGVWFGYYTGGKFYDKKPGATVVPPAVEITPAGLLATPMGTITSPVYINNVYNDGSVINKAYFIATPATLRDSLTQQVGAGYTFLKPGRESYFAISVNGTVNWSSSTYGPTNWIIDNSTGVTRAIFLGDPATLAGATVKFYGIPTVKVTMNITNYLNNGATDPDPANKENVVHGTGMNVFCGACHLDYNTASTEVYDLRGGKLGGAYAYDTGVYSKAHRHTVGTERTLTSVTSVLDYDFADGTNTGAGDKGIFTCLTCHVAHGVSKDYWNRLLVVGGKVGPSGDAWVDGELEELSGSSVLKRMPNMGTCETCHNKEYAQDGYVANSSIGATLQSSAGEGVTDVGFYPITKDTLVANLQNNLIGSKFVGSAKCEPCHAEVYAAYQKTAHSNMISYTTAAERDTWYDFLVAEGVPYGTDGTGDWIEQEDVFHTVYRFYKDDFTFNVSWGKDNLAAVYRGALGGNTGKLCVIWEEGALVEFENYGCINCHTTPKGVATPVLADLEAGLDAGTLELGIECETTGCHGNGSAHVASPSAKNIFNPGRLSITEQTGKFVTLDKKRNASQSCGLCHGSAKHNGEFWQSGLTPPGYLTATGPNPMFTAGVASCITCHDPHKNEVQDISRNGDAKEDLQLKMEVRALCNSCHENRLVTKDDFDKYLPLKPNGMPVHSMDGLGYTNFDGDPDVDITKDHRAE